MQLYEPSNGQIFIDRVRLSELGVSLKDVAAFLEQQPFMYVAFTEDEVRAQASAALQAPLKMDLRQLEILRAVVETGSFTGAGRRLNVSQSAISRQILLLEEELNEPLFLRVGRRVRITTTGETLLGLGRRVLGDIDETRASILESGRTLSGPCAWLAG